MISKLLGACALSYVIAKEGISFVVVGDMAEIQNMAPANAVFDSINSMKKNAAKGSPEDFEFFITTGDNLYPLDEQEPTSSEFGALLNLFTTREAIKDIPVHPVRGNHDCYFNDMDAEIHLNATWDKWDMPANFYHKTFVLDDLGSKFSILALDSCFYLCETVQQDIEKYLPLLGQESLELYYKKCEEGPEYVEWGNKQMAWIN